MSEEFPHGPCECDAGCTVHEERGPGPAAYSVERDGKTYKVCSRCWLTEDHNKTLLCTRDESPVPYMNWDSFGFLAIVFALRDQEQESLPNREEETTP